jgi:hypothetical protein
MLKGISISPLPLPVYGPLTLCQGTTITLSDASTGGTWSSGSPHAVVDPAGVVTGISDGPATISYTISAGCSATRDITVNPIPYAIEGLPLACIGSTTTLHDLGSGTWSASNSNATVGIVSGVVTGVSEGSVTITYTLPVTGCVSLRIVDVHPLPSAVIGAAEFCQGSAATLLDTTIGGSWSSTYTNVAVGSASGIVTGIAGGTAVVTYTLPTGCTAKATVTIDALPTVYAVTGGGNYCAGATGVHVGMSGTDAGVSYQLYHGTTTAGSSVTSSGGALDFGLMTIAGTYTVHAATATTGCQANMGGSAFVTIVPTVVPTVSFTTSTGSYTGCVGNHMKYTAVVVNGGSSPVFHWTVNGFPAGLATDTLNYIPVNGDVVKLKVTSNATCVSPDSAVSVHTITTIPYVLPVVTIGISPGSNVCVGTPVTFNATAIAGGSSPILFWKVNGAMVGSGTSYSYTPANGDHVSCTMISNVACRYEDSATAPVTMTVSAPAPPSVSITADPGLSLAAGQLAQFTANVTAGTPVVSYQWSINGADVPGATFATFASTSLVNNNIISCKVTNSDVCLSSATTQVTVHVTNGVDNIGSAIGDVQIFPNPNRGSFTVKGAVNIAEGTELSMVITNMLGEIIYRENVIVKNGSIDVPVLMDRVPANGMYLLNIRSNGTSKTINFIVEQ